ncbi:hypothetical protein SteCoe_34667 [Stentor coeruleus]|uniref:HMG box domain-containing protein n=1 Tax=Stentor coeruleus TaxID=5963 RepID=A0A1R2AU36_9CILI|nr:hypothetical protein SteCoe_34667 [Stentor coeruleus]
MDQELSNPLKQIVEKNIEKIEEMNDLHNQDKVLEENKETVSKTIINEVIKENLPIATDSNLNPKIELLSIEPSHIENPKKIQESHDEIKNLPEGQISLSIENTPAKYSETIVSVEESKNLVPEEKVNSDEPAKTLTPGGSSNEDKTPPSITVPPPVKKQLSPFQVFLNSKKPELLKENPSATHKEIVLKVTQLWGQLTEVEKRQYSL